MLGILLIFCVLSFLCLILLSTVKYVNKRNVRGAWWHNLFSFHLVSLVPSTWTVILPHLLLLNGCCDFQHMTLQTSSWGAVDVTASWDELYKPVNHLLSFPGEGEGIWTVCPCCAELSCHLETCRSKYTVSGKGQLARSPRSDYYCAKKYVISEPWPRKLTLYL